MNAQSCKPELVMAYVDGQATAQESAAARAHLEECADCRGLAADLAQVSRHVREWTVDPAPPRLEWRVQFAAESRKGPWFWSWRAAVALAGIIAVIWAVQTRRSATRNFSIDGQPGLDKLEGSDRPLADSNGLFHPPPPMIARSASLDLIAKDCAAARSSIERIVAAEHGYIQNLGTASQPGSPHTLDATLHIPSERLDAALAELRGLGVVVRESQGGEEVSQPHADLQARLTNARTTEKRLNEILATRTGKLSEVIEAESKIAQVRMEIERMDAELRGLDHRVQYAAVTLHVAEEYSTASPITLRLRNATVEGVRGLRENTVEAAEVLLRYAPTAIFWALLLFWPVRAGWRRWKP